jgi:hypothetical protein
VLLFTVTKASKVSLWTLSLADKKTAPYGNVESVFPINATFSPDGLWVAYGAAQSSQGSSAVYVQPFPATGAKYEVSKDDDGHHPVWSPDGKELSYIPGPGRFVSVAIRTQPSFLAEFPKDLSRAPFLFSGRLNERNYDILPDGQRFIGLVPASGQRVTGAAAPQIQVVLNWTEELKQRVPTHQGQ